MAKRDSVATRKRIVEQTAELLNTHGYLRTSMSEIMRVTGLQKGGIYHHFRSRDELVMETFQYVVGLVRERVVALLKSDDAAKQKLHGLIAIFEEFPVHEVLKGGCPIVNLAIETDASHPGLKSATRDAMQTLTGAFEHVIANGVKAGELATRDPRGRAAYLVAALEGGLMLSILYEDPVYLTAVGESLGSQVEAGLP